jgi:hypothetical protein
MTEPAEQPASSRGQYAAPSWCVAWLSAAFIAAISGCAAPPRNGDAIAAYDRYDFSTARRLLRVDAAGTNDEQVVLNHLRLGLAALADGDAAESEAALGPVFELLSTAGLNADRTTAAVWLHEGVRIWKGEPFEQALAYVQVAHLYAVLGDWENVRAAAANSLFRLTDFGADQTPESLVRRAAADEELLDHGYTAVDTDFALGFLMEAIGSRLSGAPGADEQLDAALEINPSLAPLIATLRPGEFDTLLIVEYGRGPAKVAYGPDEALVKFVPRERHRGDLEVSVDGAPASDVPAVCDVDRMAQDHRWNNLEDVRRAKSAIGTALLFGGGIVAARGIERRDEGSVLGGLGLIAAGLLSKSGARGDTRFMEFNPQAVYLVPLRLGEPRHVSLAVAGAPGPVLVLPEVRPGTTRHPRAVYLRLHGHAPPGATWMSATRAVYGNDHAGVRPGDFPYILGGHDVSSPSHEVLAAYHAGGHLTGMTLADLADLYRAEGIEIGAASGSAAAADGQRHILRGGRGLFTPMPDSIGYKRLFFTEWPPYEPRSELVRNAAARIGVHQSDSGVDTP